MPFYVYILQSQLDKSYDKGFTLNPIIRLAEHNAGEMKYTSTKMPWQLVYVEQFENKRDALIKERNFKKPQQT